VGKGGKIKIQIFSGGVRRQGFRHNKFPQKKKPSLSERPSEKRGGGGKIPPAAKKKKRYRRPAAEGIEGGEEMHHQYAEGKEVVFFHNVTLGGEKESAFFCQRGKKRLSKVRSLTSEKKNGAPRNLLIKGNAFERVFKGKKSGRVRLPPRKRREKPAKLRGENKGRVGEGFGALPQEEKEGCATPIVKSSPRISGKGGRGGEGNGGAALSQKKGEKKTHRPNTCRMSQRRPTNPGEGRGRALSKNQKAKDPCGRL